jgi:diguanylate cyclase (GGDEF)-like protein
MTVLSIKRYLVNGDARAEQALRRVIGVLLHAVEAHAVHGDEVDYEQFRSGLRDIASQFTDATPPQELLVMAGAVATSLKEYAERTSRYVRTQSAEYQHMVAMLTETVAIITDGSDRAVTRLRDIEKQIERASVIEDIRSLRLKLGQCLESIQEEIQQQENQAAVTAADLRAHMEKSQAIMQSVLPDHGVDPVTGLPSRAAAEAALTVAAKGEHDLYAVVFVADRVQAISSRFGHAVGDRVLRKVCEHFRSALSAEDRVFRWSGPTFVALLARGRAVEDVRKEIARIASAKLEDVIEIGARSVLLPISASWSVFPMTSSPKLLIGKIDQFARSQAPNE